MGMPERPLDQSLDRFAEALDLAYDLLLRASRRLLDVSPSRSQFLTSFH